MIADKKVSKFKQIMIISSLVRKITQNQISAP